MKRRMKNEWGENGWPARAQGRPRACPEATPGGAGPDRGRTGAGPGQDRGTSCGTWRGFWSQCQEKVNDIIKNIAFISIPERWDRWNPKVRNCNSQDRTGAGPGQDRGRTGARPAPPGILNSARNPSFGISCPRLPARVRGVELRQTRGPERDRGSPLLFIFL